MKISTSSMTMLKSLGFQYLGDACQIHTVKLSPLLQLHPGVRGRSVDDEDRSLLIN
jgi:hypothetical protein